MRIVVLLALAVIASPGLAQTCPAPIGWAKPVKHLSARAPRMKFALPVGKATALTLFPSETVKLAAVSRHEAKPGTLAGMAALDVKKPGTINLIMTTDAHVDLIRDGIVLTNAGYTDLAACAGFRKQIAFVVTPGRYIVQFIDGPEPVVKMTTVFR